jgi:hypothetical protein
MKMKECKQKVKEFASKHKKKLIVAGAVGAGVVGGLVGWAACSKRVGNKYVCINRRSSIAGVLADAIYTYPSGHVSGTQISSDTYTCEQLGKFGEFLTGKDADLAAKTKFTHIIAIGNDE